LVLSDPFVMILASLAFGAFAGLDRAISRVGDGVAPHAMAGISGLLAVKIILVPTLLGTIDQVGITEALIFAAIVAVPVAVVCQGVMMALIAFEGDAHPPADLVSLSSATWLGALCAAGSWRLMIVSMLVLVLFSILRPRTTREPDAPVAAAPFRAMTPMGPRMMLPEQLALSSMGKVSHAAGVPKPVTPQPAVQAPDARSSAARVTSPVRRVPACESLDPIPPSHERRGPRHVQDPRTVRGYCLRHHRHMRYGTHVA
jgi:hypothetical protein